MPRNSTTVTEPTFTPVLSDFELYGDWQPDGKEAAIVFNFKVKQLAQALSLGVAASRTPLELAKQVVLTLGTAYLVQLDEAISNGRSRSKAAGSARTLTPAELVAQRNREEMKERLRQSAAEADAEGSNDAEVDADESMAS